MANIDQWRDHPLVQEQGKRISNSTVLIFTKFFEFSKAISETLHRGKIGDEDKRSEMENFLNKRFSECRIMLVEPSDEFEKSDDHIDASAPLDLPFPDCFFEMPRSNYVVYTTNPLSGEKKQYELLFIMVHEIDQAPGEYFMFAYGFEATGKDQLPWFYFFTNATSLSDIGKKVFTTDPWLMTAVRNLCRTIRKSSAATEKVNFRQKGKVDGEKRIHKIKEIIHIVPNKKYQIKKVDEHSVIEWSHRWEVRGHWRKCPGIGKDRYGKYGMNGFTWVNPHEKGPENKLLVKKIRTIKENNSGESLPTVDQGEHSEGQEDVRATLETN